MMTSMSPSKEQRNRIGPSVTPPLTQRRLESRGLGLPAGGGEGYEEIVRFIEVSPPPLPTTCQPIMFSAERLS